MTNILTLEGFVEGCAFLCCNDEWDNFGLLPKSKFSVEIPSDSNSVVVGSWEIFGKRMQGLFVLPRRYETWHSLQFFCSQPVKPRARLITWLPFVLPSTKAEGRSFLLQRGGRSQDVAQESRSVRRTWGSASNSRASLGGGGRRGPSHQLWCPSHCCRSRFM